MHHTRKTGSGFTLVELLVVIGIIAVLIAILLPTINAARRQASTAACMANLRSLGQAFAGYTQDFKSYPWAAYYSAAGGQDTAGDGSDSIVDKQTYVWWSVMRGYMRGKGAPYDNSIASTTPGGTPLTRFMVAFSCPTANDRDAGCDFVCNDAIMPWQATEVLGSTDRHPLNWQVARPHKPQWVYPDNIILFDACELGNVDPPFSRQYVTSFELDSHSGGSPLRGTFNQPKKPTWRYRAVKDYSANPNLGDSFPIDPGPNVDSGNQNARGNIRWRHGKNDTANFLFADGSVKSMRITTGYGTSNARGEVLRKLFRPKPNPAYKMLDL